MSNFTIETPTLERAGSEDTVMPRCCVCKVALGYSNPRQLCNKTWCPESIVDSDPVYSAEYPSDWYEEATYETHISCTDLDNWANKYGINCSNCNGPHIEDDDVCRDCFHKQCDIGNLYWVPGYASCDEVWVPGYYYDAEADLETDFHCDTCLEQRQPSPEA